MTSSILGVLGALFFAFTFWSSYTEAQTSKKVIGYVAWWDQTRGINGVKDDIDLFSAVSPNWYTFDATGAVIPYRNAQGVPYVDQSFVSYLRANNVAVIPVIQNATPSGWSGSLARGVISDPTKRAAHIASIVNLTVSQQYDGIDIDYEAMLASDRALFTTFIQELATALHAQGKTLAVSVYPKTSEPGTWDGPQGQDWAALGAAADELRIMIYGYSWQSSVPGSIAPFTWVSQVLAFAKTVIPNQKIIHGIPTYGIDWPQGSAGTEQMWDVLVARAATYGATVRWDTTAKAPWFQYTVSGNMHTAWFENASSTDAKLEATIAQNAAGISVWRLGGEDPKTWDVVRARFGSNGAGLPSADIQANGSDVAITIAPNSAATISWTSTGADTCSVTPTGWTELSNAGISTGPLSAATTYTLSCTNAQGTMTDSVAVNIAAADNTPPSVSITSPANGATVTKRVSISATASDNVAVKHVQFYVDGALILTDTSAPYSATWNAMKAAEGNHVIKVVAEDVAGNTSEQQITVRK